MAGGATVAPRAPAPVPAAPSLPAPQALARALARRPPCPVALAGVLDGRSGAPAFRRVVLDIFPEGAAAILAAERPGLGRAGSRVAAFLELVGAEIFPVYEFDEGWYDDEGDAYNAVLRGIPFVRLAWDYEDLHDLDRRIGHRLLLAICEHPYLAVDDAHLALLESLATLVPVPTLLQIPRSGLHPQALHARLDGGRFAAAAEFGDWVWGGTGTVFLDIDDEVPIVDADWTVEIVADLAEQWRRADAMLTRIDALAAWLEGDPPARFAELVSAAVEPADVGQEGQGEAASDAPLEGESDARSADDNADPGCRGDDGEPLPARRAA